MPVEAQYSPSPPMSSSELQSQYPQSPPMPPGREPMAMLYQEPIFTMTPVGSQAVLQAPLLVDQDGSSASVQLRTVLRQQLPISPPRRSRPSSPMPASPPQGGLTAPATSSRSLSPPQGALNSWSVLAAVQPPTSPVVPARQPRTVTSASARSSSPLPSCSQLAGPTRAADAVLGTGPIRSLATSSGGTVRIASPMRGVSQGCQPTSPMRGQGVVPFRSQASSSAQVQAVPSAWQPSSPLGGAVRGRDPSPAQARFEAMVRDRDASPLRGQGASPAQGRGSEPEPSGRSRNRYAAQGGQRQ